MHTCMAGTVTRRRCATARPWRILAMAPWHTSRSHRHTSSAGNLQYMHACTHARALTRMILQVHRHIGKCIHVRRTSALGCLRYGTHVRAPHTQTCTQRNMHARNMHAGKFSDDRRLNSYGMLLNHPSRTIPPLHVCTTRMCVRPACVYDPHVCMTRMCV